jgi:hypothetical protein
MTNYSLNEWKELFDMALWSTNYQGSYQITRVPGGVLYKYEFFKNETVTYYHGGPTSSLDNSQTSLVFCPFPPSLGEKLNAL